MPATKTIFTTRKLSTTEMQTAGATYIVDSNIPSATIDNPSASLDYIRDNHDTGVSVIVFRPDHLDIEEDEDMIRLAGTTSPEEDGEVPYTEDLATLASLIRANQATMGEEYDEDPEMLDINLENV